MLHIYNTLSNRKESFTPLNPPHVSLYVCGPTVYDSAHIGHAMSYLVFDVIRRYLSYRGFSVRHVQNFTDVEDKIILRAAERGLPWRDLVRGYIDEFLAEMDALNVCRAHAYPYASREIPAIVSLIEGLIDSGHAYVRGGDVFFRVHSKADYGKLSGQRPGQMLVGARIDVDTRKQHGADFALWKASKPGEPAWPSPWGRGRPGWHIECSAMSLRYLGAQIDIHGGGADLVFPHHENEIVQSECFTGREPFARFWVHNGLLRLQDAKMSKSIGNLITIRELLNRYEPNAFRLLILSRHYRSPLAFSFASLEAAQSGWRRLARALQMSVGGGTATGLTYPLASETVPGALAVLTRQTRERFIAAMDDDFNTAAALGALFDLARAVASQGDEMTTPADWIGARACLLELLGVLGFDMRPRVPGRSVEEDQSDKFIDLLLVLRTRLRAARQWALADQVRDDLAQHGIVVEDGPNGSTWRRA